MTFPDYSTGYAKLTFDGLAASYARSQRILAEQQEPKTKRVQINLALNLPVGSDPSEIAHNIALDLVEHGYDVYTSTVAEEE